MSDSRNVTHSDLEGPYVNTQTENRQECGLEMLQRRTSRAENPYAIFPEAEDEQQCGLVRQTISNENNSRHEAPRIQDETKSSKNHCKWIFLAMIFSMLISTGVAVGLYFKAVTNQQLSPACQTSNQSIVRDQTFDGNQTLAGNETLFANETIDDPDTLLDAILLQGQALKNLSDEFAGLRQEFYDLVRDINNDISALTHRINQINPNEAQPDPGWTTPGNGYQYRFTDSPVDWLESRQVCLRDGGDLAAVGLRNVDLRGSIKTIAGNMWIGLSDLALVGNWAWIDGTPVTNPGGLWESGQPAREKYCGAMNSNLKAFASDCTNQARAICEKPIS